MSSAGNEESSCMREAVRREAGQRCEDATLLALKIMERTGAKEHDSFQKLGKERKSIPSFLEPQGDTKSH